jgi:hypothetical protein
VSWGGGYDKAFEFLSKLKANTGVFGVLGDSDYQDSRKACNFCHTYSPKTKDLPVQFLKNNSVHLGGRGEPPDLSGLEQFFVEDLFLFLRIFEERAGSPEIVLSHEQVDLNEFSGSPVLVLCGNTHGGQVFMPAKVWEWFFSKTKGRIRTGLVQEGKAKLYVSSGIGTNRFPFRFLCPPEIVLFKGE